MSSFSTVLIGNESLLIQCGEQLLTRGHGVAAVVTRSKDVAVWAAEKGLHTITPGPDLVTHLPATFDWLLSIANLDMLDADVLACPQRGGINFHDGPLPAYAGLNAPVWALKNGEARHGISWHHITSGADRGNILVQRLFDIHPNDTALTLNTRCYEAALDSFPDLMDLLETGDVAGQPQDFAQRSYYGFSDRPAAGGHLDFTQGAGEISALVRALDHGGYWNPLCCAKITLADRLALVGSAQPATLTVPAGTAPGTVLAADADALTVACGDGAVIFSKLSALNDRAFDIALPVVGARLTQPDATETADISAALQPAAQAEAMLRPLFETLTPATLPAMPTGATGLLEQPLDLPADQAITAWGLVAAQITGNASVDLAYHASRPSADAYLLPWTPLRMVTDADVTKAHETLHAALTQARSLGAVAADLPARLPGALQAQPLLAISDSVDPCPDALVTLCLSPAPTLRADAAQVPQPMLTALAARVGMLASADGAIADLPRLATAEREMVLSDWNQTAVDYNADLCLHQMFERQVAQTPHATALVVEGDSFTYLELNTRANQVAHVLRDLGVKPGTLVGLNTQRTPHLIIGALGILKAGGAYVPLDPAFPPDRIALYVEDSACQIIVTQQGMLGDLPAHQAEVLAMDRDPRILSAPTDNLDVVVAGSDLAYMIYTSGSTGRPKGVMVEHRNLSNFFTGMDGVICPADGTVWLAVTSLNFDISVLELFYTLTRGFKLVLSADDNRALVSSGPVNQTGRGMDFSLFYWGNDDGVGRDKYELLFEGATFADQNGFCAVWTPERHFHAFGGPYPNPSVTGAAVAALTQNIAVRAGSCVAPLHHPARVAEEWAVIDNLTNGRTGIGIASGWQPHDFVLRPENTPPENKPAMLRSIEQLRALWRGEAVEFPMGDGSMHPIVTQPRPVSKTLQIWVTTAGNPATWREAGEIGANVLTHLLGQSIEEVGEKIKIYHAALREAGHDPADFTVTLMLHTFVAEDREAARDIAREPMKDYLRSAAGLIKQFAWAFPAFKRPEGVKNAFDLNLDSLDGEELEAILDFAFQRYFEDSGLFGTVNDCLARVEQLKRIGVDEVACLIDYGIEKKTVLQGLTHLARVLEGANVCDTLADDDFSIAAQILRHDVTHLQCTPSMARMIAMNDEARFALGRINHLLIGGEALPGDLVSDLRSVTEARISNMYGPTETTIWSTTAAATGDEATANIGTPLANQQVYVLDDQMQPMPIGAEGELYIGGAGVTRGYWQHEDLTSERFLPDPFIPGNRIYRTGDLVRWRGDGRLDYLGRADHQVKLRGYRIELGEIEAAIATNAAITQAVVVARDGTSGTTQLVGYYTASAAVDEAALRAGLATNLPDYMVPSAFVRMDQFPLTPNKKIDRNALPAPETRRAEAVPALPLSDDIQHQVAAIWSDILGVHQIGPRDNFFDLGGHSLLAVQAHREIRMRLGATSLAITDIFRFPVLEALCAKLTEGLSTKPSTPAATENHTPLAPTTQTAQDGPQSRSDAMARRREMRKRRMAKRNH
ncbi:MupA/Atu3671 family FMN-dependent luciferase-like monooxygenase [Thalassobius sp. Cn5-15]|uniref:MupA/Atu3671 family FMN-dependent luciferase-like monooxygenase n=1 Tax=Thalassobius sp. Cn5-15 TaxID=2917763 RepID=UPI001EF1A726|nr:MupA/Atu3671 family FMN-dependent luciferase-like monooxygenase [Thalassobius sp. Cn5-15]MCG7494059.1 LLM class flavin-dependent oxidoreductase [Thalassobius sp. Cn5-15]